MEMISHRNAQANVSRMENYDASKRNSYIMYLDLINLYDGQCHNLYHD